MESSETRQDNKKFKITLKHWAGTVIVAIAAGFIIFVMLNGREFLANYFLSREQEKIQEEFERPYREDKYGGKTPEETFDMFLDALRKGDIDLASKYFVLDKQEQWRGALKQLKDQDILSDFINELATYKNNWTRINNDKNEARFEYEVIFTEPQVVVLPNGVKDSFPPGTYRYEIIFIKYFSNVDIWKISTL